MRTIEFLIIKYETKLEIAEDNLKFATSLGKEVFQNEINLLNEVIADLKKSKKDL